MRSRHLVKTLVILVAAALALPFVAAAQTHASGWTVPRTPWGDPDIQGLWPANDMQGTPYDRCITRGVLASMLPTGYNMGTEIMQIPGAVIIRNEMIHETRIIPVDGRPRLSSNIRQYMGDSRGRWEGDTLVIETTNFNGKVGITRNGNTLLTSPDLKLVERITRVDADTLQYEELTPRPARPSRRGRPKSKPPHGIRLST